MSGNGKVSHGALMAVVQPGKMPEEFEVIGQLYSKRGRNGVIYTSWRFPFESGVEGETPHTTATNGMHQELSMTPDNPEKFEFTSPDIVSGQLEPNPFLVSRCAGDSEKGTEWHDKYVFVFRLLGKSRENLRTVEKQDGPDEIIGPPVFMEASVLWQKMSERGHPFHRAVLYRLIKRFACNNAAVRERYGFILDEPYSQELMKNREGPIRFDSDK